MSEAGFPSDRESDAPIIRVEDLVKSFRVFKRREGFVGSVRDLFHREYRNLHAVDRITFSIRPGERVGYIGPNGAGKSTTVKMLTGILTPTSGTLEVAGFVPHRERMNYTRNIGVVFGQRTALWWDIAVVESFRLLQRIYEVSQADYDARMKTFAEVLDLDPLLHTPVRKLSLGQRMRCDLAAALLHNPPIVFLDEPTIGLDVVAKEEIRKFLRWVNKEYGTTVILTTHDLADIEELCPRILIIDRGKILYDGSLAGLKDRMGHSRAVTFDFTEPPEAGRIEGLVPGDGIRWERIHERSVRAVFSRDRITAARLIAAVTSKFDVHDLTVTDIPVEEIIRRIYREGLVSA